MFPLPLPLRVKMQVRKVTVTVRAQPRPSIPRLLAGNQASLPAEKRFQALFAK